MHRFRGSTSSHFRDQVADVTASGDEHIIVKYSRRALSQTGDGHFSPIGGFHSARDLVLILDTGACKCLPSCASFHLTNDAEGAVLVVPGAETRSIGNPGRGASCCLHAHGAPMRELVHTKFSFFGCGVFLYFNLTETKHLLTQGRHASARYHPVEAVSCSCVTCFLQMLCALYRIWFSPYRLRIYSQATW